MMKKITGFLIVCAIMASLFSGMLIVSASNTSNIFTFNDANISEKYANSEGSALSKITLNSDTAYTYGNAMYSALLDLSNGNKWGTNKASIAKMGLPTDWSSYDVLKVRYYSTLENAFYSVFLTDSETSDSNRYRFTVYADKSGWQVADIDLNRLKKSGSPSLSNIQCIQIRTDNNTDSTGGKSAQVGSGATSGLKFYFDQIWLDNYNNDTINFTDDKVFDDQNWVKDNGDHSKGQLATTTSTYFEGSGKAGKIELTNQKWGTNYGDISKFGMTTDWSGYDTLNIRFRSKIQDAFYTVFLYCSDSFASGGLYKVKITAKKADWQTLEIPLDSLKTKNSPTLSSVKYIQIRTDNNSDGGEQVGSGQVSGLTFYFDKIWLTKSDLPAAHDFKYVYSNGEAVIKGIDALSVEGQADMVIPSEINGNKVVKIDSDAFKGNTNIVNLTLPDTLKEISDNAFANCSKLLYITMPSCEKIRGSAFYGCGKLSVINSDYAGEVVFPKNLKEIKDGAFRSANVIRTVILPASIEKLGNVFYRTVGIKNIYFPETIPQDAYKKTFLGGSTDFNTVNAFGTKDSYIATYAKSEDAVDNSTADDYEKSGKKLYNYIEENSGILVMNTAVTPEGTTAGVDARIFNVGDTEATLTAIVAIYGDKGELKGIDVANNIKVPAYAGYSITKDVLCAENVEVENNDVAKVLFWENLESLTPAITQNVVLTLNVSANEEVVD